MAPTTAPTTAIRHALSTLAAPSIIATVGVGLELAVVKFIDRRGTPEPVGTGFTPVGSIGKVVVTGVTEEVEPMGMAELTVALVLLKAVQKE